MEPPIKNNSNIITVFSTTSAVGKTMLTINLAAEFMKKHYKVCIVDLDLQFGDVCNYLKLLPAFTLYDYQAQLEKSNNEHFIAQYMTKYNDALDILAAPLKIEESYNITAETITKVLEQVTLAYDYVVIDTTPGFSDINLAATDISNTIMFVGIVDFIPTIKNMKIGYDTMRSIGYAQDKIKLVLNRNKAKTNIELRDVESLLEEKFYHTLPNDFKTTILSIQEGVPIVIKYASTELAQSIKELVSRCTNGVETDSRQEKARSWLDRWFQ